MTVAKCDRCQEPITFWQAVKRKCPHCESSRTAIAAATEVEKGAISAPDFSLAAIATGFGWLIVGLGSIGTILLAHREGPLFALAGGFGTAFSGIVLLSLGTLLKRLK